MQVGNQEGMKVGNQEGMQEGMQDRQSTRQTANIHNSHGQFPVFAHNFGGLLYLCVRQLRSTVQCVSSSS